MADEFLHKDLTHQIIGAAMGVHRILGHGFLESVYEEALTHEFKVRKIPVERQVKLTVGYKDIVVGDFRADFNADTKVVIELKATKTITDIDQAQLLNYLKVSSHRVGLLQNFGTPSLEYKRRVL